MEYLTTFIKIMIYTIAIKSMLICEFNFYYWFKYKKKYIKWLNNKPTFKDHLKNNMENLTIDQFKSILFSAYLTGQTDIRNKMNNIERRSFESWFNENFKKE
jgi:hypothetical protein